MIPSAPIIRFDTYADAIDWLQSRLDLERQPTARLYDPTHYNLAGFGALLQRLGSPHRRLPVIHIAGTKGKGSVAAMLESALRAAGLRTGLYTSPHYRDYTDRIRLNGDPISPSDFARVLGEVATAAAGEGPGALGAVMPEGPASLAPWRTVFELLTAMGFLAFQQARVDVAVLETGLGGRLDATNVCPAPLVTAITALGLDHVALLGRTLDLIAREKAGIVKPGVPCVVAEQSAEAEQLGVPEIVAAARERGAQVVRSVLAPTVAGAGPAENPAHPVIRAHTLALPAPDASPPPQGLVLEVEGATLELLLPLAGPHQVENLRTAAAVWAVLRERCEETGPPLSRANLTWEAFARGIGECRWAGRFDVVPDPATHITTIIDGAHCALSSARLRETIAEDFPGRPMHIVFGVQRDKSPETMLETLASAAAPRRGDGRSVENPVRGLHAYEPTGGRGMHAADVKQLWESLAARRGDLLAAGATPAIAHGGAAEAYRAARSAAQPGDLVVCCGTLYAVADLLDLARALSQR